MAVCAKFHSRPGTRLRVGCGDVQPMRSPLPTLEEDLNARGCQVRHKRLGTQKAYQ